MQKDAKFSAKFFFTIFPLLCADWTSAVFHLTWYNQNLSLKVVFLFHNHMLDWRINKFDPRIRYILIRSGIYIILDFIFTFFINKIELIKIMIIIIYCERVQLSMKKNTLSTYLSKLKCLYVQGPNSMNLKYVAQLPTAGSNLNHRRKDLNRQI